MAIDDAVLTSSGLGVRGREKIEIDSPDIGSNCSTYLPVLCHRFYRKISSGTVFISGEIEQLDPHRIQTDHSERSLAAVNLDKAETQEGDPGIIEDNRVQRADSFRQIGPKTLEELPGRDLPDRYLLRPAEMFRRTAGDKQKD